jgi:hypothetical protein
MAERDFELDQLLGAIVKTPAGDVIRIPLGTSREQALVAARRHDFQKTQGREITGTLGGVQQTRRIDSDIVPQGRAIARPEFLSTDPSSQEDIRDLLGVPFGISGTGEAERRRRDTLGSQFQGRVAPDSPLRKSFQVESEQFLEPSAGNRILANFPDFAATGERNVDPILAEIDKLRKKNR